jgi:hypothetical protein
MVRDYPKEWKKFCDIEKTYGGFTYYSLRSKTTIGDLNRFAARYALAKDLDKIIIKNSSEDTMLGYETLMRSLLVWSTSELYFSLLPPQSETKYTFLTFTTSEKNKLRNSLTSIGPDLNNFYYYIRDSKNIDKPHKDSVNDFLSGGDFNPMRLLSSVRHTFGHGELSANVNGVNPKSIEFIVNLLKDAILDKIDENFSSLVKKHPDYSKV